MKKRKLLLGVTASALSILALASCGDKDSKGNNTSLKGVKEVTSEVLKNIISDDTATSDSKQVSLALTGNYTYSSISYIDSDYYEYRTTSEGVKTLYCKLANRDICEIKDNMTLKDADSYDELVNVITRVDGEEISYKYDVYNYLGEKVISYKDQDGYNYFFNYSNENYYDDDGNYHQCRKYFLTTSDGNVKEFYKDYCQETNKTSYYTSKPNDDKPLKPGYSEIFDGLYARRETLTDGFKFYLYDDEKEYEPFKLPLNITEAFKIKDKIIYQTEKVLPDDATSYSYYRINESNGETIKYELKSYMYDYKEAKLKSIKLPYIRSTYEVNDVSDYAVVDFVKIVDGELNEQLNSMYGFVNSKGSLEYMSNKVVDYETIIELDSGYFYDNNYDIIYDENLDFVTEVSSRISDSLFIDSTSKRIVDNYGTSIMEYDTISIGQNNIITIDGERYEVKGVNLNLISSDETISNGWIYKFIDLNPSDLTSARYKIEARKAGESVSVVYYSNYEATLNVNCAFNNAVCYNSSYSIYSSQDLTNGIRYINIK